MAAANGQTNKGMYVFCVTYLCNGQISVMFQSKRMTSILLPLGGCMRIKVLAFPLKSSENHRFFDDFRGKRS